ncbi:Endophilin-A2 [Thoreauomyces humboldtii]|nr:Endophilin-A2 [Thoreauomyces humboldtii]
MLSRIKGSSGGSSGGSVGKGKKKQVTDLSDLNEHGNAAYREHVRQSLQTNLATLSQRNWISSQALELLVSTLAQNGLNVDPNAPLASHPSSAPVSRTTYPDLSYSKPNAAAPSPPIPSRAESQPIPHLTTHSVLRTASAAGLSTPASSTISPPLPGRSPSITKHQYTPPESRSVSPNPPFPAPSPSALKKAYTVASPHLQQQQQHQSTASSPALMSLASLSLNKSSTPTPTPPPVSARPLSRRTVVAVEDHVPTEDGDLGFQKGDIVVVQEDVDENWYKGTFRGKSGIFPKSFVQSR